jgi:hypothetical protein
MVRGVIRLAACAEDPPIRIDDVTVNELEDWQVILGQ